MTAEHLGTHEVPLPRGRALVDELLRRMNVQPIRGVEDPNGQGIFETDEELQEFVEYTYTTRHSELA
jgi:hypothetical protein